ncbi:hypothetical protein BBJ28_00022336 [Nothophytophthora sp. Chile5]|nr:hypothetical protein BBJ28_00022336 [Nothophytophthora sp. Chile5]
MKPAPCGLACLLLVSALLASHGVFAGLVMQFFKNANFKGDFGNGSIGEVGECHNLPDAYAKQVSSMRWTSTKTATYGQFEWLYFYAQRDCAGEKGMSAFANETKNLPANLADNGFNDQMSSYWVRYTHG